MSVFRNTKSAVESAVLSKFSRSNTICSQHYLEHGYRNLLATNKKSFGGLARRPYSKCSTFNL